MPVDTTKSLDMDEVRERRCGGIERRMREGERERIMRRRRVRINMIKIGDKKE